MSYFQYPNGIETIGMTYAQKDDEYRKKMLDYYCTIANDFTSDFSRMRENYALKNSRLPKEQYRYLCGVLGENERTDMFIDMFNFTGNVIDSLKGEELGRPFPFTVIANSDAINNRNEREKQNQIRSLMQAYMGGEVEKVIKLQELATKDIPQEELQQKSAEIELEFQKRYNKLPNIKDIVNKYENMSSLEEITMNKIMKILYNKLNIKKIKNDCWEDLLLVAGEFVEIYVNHVNTLPQIKRLNTLFTFYQKSPNLEYIDMADFAGYRERVSMDEVLEEYGEYLSDEDYEEIVTEGGNFGILGYEQKWNSKHNPDPWRAQRFGQNGAGYGGGSEWENVGRDEFGGDAFGNIPSSKVIDHMGIHMTPQRSGMNRFVDKYVVYWKSKRKVGRLTYVNDYNEIEDTIVSDEFVIPKSAKKITTRRDNLTKSIVEWVWADGRGKKMSIEWMTINEVWKGIRIGNKRVLVEPLVATYRSLLNPFEVRLPIYGVIVNNANATSLSKMDAMKPWQKLYFAMMAKVLKMIHLDRGTWTFFNSLFIDPKMGVEKTIAVAEDQGLFIYNPAATAKDGSLSSLLSSMKIADKIDMSNSQSIQQYLQLLMFIEENITKSAGMSPQRIAQSVANSTATDNYRETQSSMNITEPLFYAHDLLWERIMNGLMEQTLLVLSENSGILRDVLNDEEKSVIDLKFVKMTDNYRLRVGNSGKQVRVLEMATQLAQALVQNDKINLSQLIKLMKTEDLTEFQTNFAEIEELNRKREEGAQQAQQAHEKEMLDMQLKANEDAQVNDLQKIALKGKLDFEKERMKGILNNQSFDAEKDYNKDGVPDYFQQEQLMARVKNEGRKLDLEELKIHMDAKVKEKEMNDKDKELALKREETMLKSGIDEKKLENQKRIDKIKHSARK